MLETPSELAALVGARIRALRKARKLTQQEAAARAGVSYGTWRRMEAAGKASIEDMARAAIALRSEETVRQLFSLPLIGTTAIPGSELAIKQLRAVFGENPKGYPWP